MASRGGGGRDYSSLKGAKIGFTSQSGDDHVVLQSRSDGTPLNGTNRSSSIGFTGQSGDNRVFVQSRSGGTLLSRTTPSSIAVVSQSGGGNGAITAAKGRTVLGT